MSTPRLAPLLCAILATCATPPRSVAPPPDYARATADLEEMILRELEDKGVPGLSIALMDGDTIVWAKGFGTAAPNTPATARTVYRVASISKLVTDTLVMQLVADRDLDLDAPVTDYLPDFAPDNPFDRPITLRQLMSHRAGLVREPPVGNYFDPTEPTLAATVDSLNDTALVYRPGTRMKYSNAGLGVVGRILETQLDQPFADIAQQRLLDPLQMSDSSFRRPRELESRRSVGPMRTYDKREIPTPDFTFGFTSAADLESTVLDLLRFAHSWFPAATEEQRLLTQDALREMWRVQFAPRRQTSGTGLGFFVRELDGHLRVGHNGAAYGCASELAALPDEELAVAVVTPLDFANDFSAGIADRALQWMLATRQGEEPPPLLTTAPLPLTQARDLVGRYGGPDDWVTLSIRDDELFLQPSHGMGSRLRQRGDALVTDGYLDWGGQRITDWQTDPSTLTVNGRPLPRLANTRPLASPAPWRILIGEYGWDHNTLIVFEENGKLCILIEWLIQYPLESLAPDHFRLQDRGLYPGEQVTFLRDDNSITGVRLGGVLFPRLHTGPDEGVTFRIEPQHPTDVLRQMAADGSPPPQPENLRTPDLQELRDLDDTIRYDIRYASTNNFMGMVFYPEARAMLQRPAADALVRAHRKLRDQGYGLLIHDAYRPWSVTKMFWDATPEDLRLFVADPANGSRHNRGCAVDLSLYDLRTGEPILMVSGYDEFTPRAYPLYVGTTDRQRWHRELLRSTMEAEGFQVYEFEWWHFDYHMWREYPVLDLPFQ